MGPREILRAAGVALLVCAAAGRAAGEPRARVAVIDLRAPGAPAVEPFAGLSDLEIVDVAGAATLERFLATADPEAMRGALEKALVAQLLAADAKGDEAAAQKLAALLRNLRGNERAPEGVPAATWQRTPAIDAATNVFSAPVLVETDPAGARVWIDYQDVGPAPVERVLPPGEHLIVAFTPEGTRASTTATVAEKRAQTVHLTLAPAQSAWIPAPSIAAMMERDRLDLVVVVRQGDARVYAAGKQAGEAKLAELPALVGKTLGRSAPAPAAAVAPKNDTGPRAMTRRSWWIYAGAIGAVVVGAAFVWALQSGSDTQRIEVRWP